MAQETPSQDVTASTNPPPMEGREKPVPVPQAAYDIPPHSKTKSTLAPTSEFARIFLLAWAVRYIPRGILGEAFHARTFDRIKIPVNGFIRRFPLKGWATKVDKVLAENAGEVKKLQEHIKAGGTVVEGHLGTPGYMRTPLLSGLRKHIREWRVGGGSGSEAEDIIRNVTWENGVPKMGAASVDKWHDYIRGRLYDMTYSMALGIGSTWLSWSYSSLVRKDIHNIFREAVAYEKDIPQEKVTFRDITSSDNAIVQGTIKNYHAKMWQRFGTDAIFFLVTPLKSLGLTDAALGIKGLQVFSDTWNRKTTLFEDFVGFINNKINPRNGLGQPIVIGELFDIYQHYTEQFNPNDMFSNVISRNAVEYDVWAKSQPVFQRMAELMNNSYAYKSGVKLDASGNPIVKDDFTLPKFIYLLGHNLIRPREPERTRMTIEIANTYGIKAIKDMEAILASGGTLDTVAQRYPVAMQTNAAPSAQEPTSKPVKEQVTSMARTGDMPATRVRAASMQLDPALAVPSTMAQTTA